MVKFTPRQLTENVNISKISHKREFFTFLSGLVLILLVVYLLSGVVMNVLIDKIPSKFEGTLARFINVKNFSTPNELLPAKQKVQKVLNGLTVLLPGSLNSQYSVEVLKNDDINAFALPGNRIIFFSGLFKRIESENELSFILAHELGHFEYKDHLRALGRGMLFVFFAAILVGNNPGLNDFLSGSFKTINLKFSREQEKRADLFALDLLKRRYGHVGGAIDFFKIMNGKNKLPKILSFTSTHPMNSQRVGYINDLIAEKRYKVGPVKPFDVVIEK